MAYKNPLLQMQNPDAGYAPLNAALPDSGLIGAFKAKPTPTATPAVKVAATAQTNVPRAQSGTIPGYGPTNTAVSSAASNAVNAAPLPSAPSTQGAVNASGNRMGWVTAADGSKSWVDLDVFAGTKQETDWLGHPIVRPAPGSSVSGGDVVGPQSPSQQPMGNPASAPAALASAPAQSVSGQGSSGQPQIPSQLQNLAMLLTMLRGGGGGRGFFPQQGTNQSFWYGGYPVSSAGQQYRPSWQNFTQYPTMNTGERNNSSLRQPSGMSNYNMGLLSMPQLYSSLRWK